MKKLVYILFIGLLFAACEEDDMAPVVDPSTHYMYPLASFELGDPSHDGAVFNEKDADPLTNVVDTIVVNITFDKPIPFATEFTVYPDSTSTATLGEDYTVINAVVPANTTTGQLVIEITGDNFPEVDETANLTVKPIDTDGEQYDLMLDPATQFLNFSFTINNYNSEDDLTMAFEWNADQASDLDVVIFDDAGNEFSYVASADNPELGEIIPNSAPDGTYYVNIDDYAVEADEVEFTFTFHSPNGEVNIFDGVFVKAEISNYDSDYSTTLASDTYRFVQVEKSGSTYTLTYLH